MDSYKGNEIQWIWGVPGKFAVDFSEAMSGPFVVNGGGVTRRNFKQGTAPVNGQTADGVNAMYGITLPVYQETVIERFLSDRAGYLMIARKDAKFGYVIRCNVSGASQVATVSANVNVSITLEQSAVEGAVGGILATSGTPAITTGDKLWIYTPTGNGNLSSPNASRRLVENELAVVGKQLLAEGF